VAIALEGFMGSSCVIYTTIVVILQKCEISKSTELSQ
jgi:hypothetical protein